MQTLIPLKIIKFTILFFKYVIALVRKFLKTFFSSIKSNTLGGFLIFSIPTSIKFDFNSSETSQNLFDKLINVFPKSCYLEKKIDKKKFSFYFKKKNI